MRDWRGFTFATFAGQENIETLNEALDLISMILQTREKYFTQALLGLGILWLLLTINRSKNRFGALISGVDLWAELHCSPIT